MISSSIHTAQGSWWEQAAQDAPDLNGQVATNAFEFLASVFQQGNFFKIQYGDWANGSTGSGSISNSGSAISVSTGSTAASTGLARNTTTVLSVGYGWGVWDLTRKLLLKVVINQRSNDANATTYLQFKAATTHGDLAAAGMGFKIANLTLEGEIHDGSTRSTVGSGAMTVNQAHEVTIEWDGSSKFEIFLDGTSLGTITTNLPTGQINSCSLVLSAGNGATAASRDVEMAIERFDLKD